MCAAAGENVYGDVAQGKRLISNYYSSQNAVGEKSPAVEKTSHGVEESSHGGLFLRRVTPPKIDAT